MILALNHGGLCLVHMLAHWAGGGVLYTSSSAFPLGTVLYLCVKPQGSALYYIAQPQGVYHVTALTHRG